MKSGSLLFVYGTLRHGESADLSRNPAATFVGDTGINACLYDLGWFPGIKLIEGLSGFDYDMPVVYGDLFRLETDDIVGDLDGYEGYPSLYNRQEVLTELGDTAWVYTYNHAVSNDRRIVSGDWCAHAKKSKPVIHTAA